VKKLLLILSLLSLTSGTYTSEIDEQPQESSSYFTKENIHMLLLYLTARIQMSFHNGISYIKSFFQAQPSNQPSTNLIIPTQPHNAEKALALVAQDLAIIQSSLPQPQPQPLLSAKNEAQKNKQQAEQKIKMLLQPKGKSKVAPKTEPKTKPYSAEASKGKPIEEIDSPAIQKEKSEITRKQLTNLVQHVQELDMIIAQLPAVEWPLWHQKQTALLEPAAPALKHIIQYNIKNSWQEHGTAIITLALQATGMGVTGALAIFAAQYAKMATGNLQTLDTDALLASFLTYASAHLIATSNTLLITNTAIQSTLTATQTNLLYQTIISPSMQTKNYQFKMPLFKGVIHSVIMNEASAILNTMLAQNGEIAQAIKNINIKQVLFGKKISPTSNIFVAQVLPKVKKAINNQQLALALTEVGWIFFQSATLGGLFWMAGVGYANNTFVESVGNAVLTGMAQGIVANVAAFTNNTTPGALLTVSSIPLSKKIVAATGVNIATTPQSIVTGVIQAIGTEATNFLINESEKAGGLWETLQKGKTALGSAISSRWSDAWNNVTEAWNTLQDIEPIPL
jgi:hypothetical protein